MSTIQILSHKRCIGGIKALLTGISFGEDESDSGLEPQTGSKVPSKKAWLLVSSFITSLACQSPKLIIKRNDADITAAYIEYVELIKSQTKSQFTFENLTFLVDPLSGDLDLDDERILKYAWIGYAWIKSSMNTDDPVLLYRELKKDLKQVTGVTIEVGSATHITREQAYKVSEKIPVGNMQSRVTFWIHLCRVLERGNNQHTKLRSSLSKLIYRLGTDEGALALREFVDKGRVRGCLDYTPFKSYEAVFEHCPANMPGMFIDTLSVVRLKH